VFNIVLGVDIQPLNHNLPINTNNYHTCTNGDEDDGNKDNNDCNDGVIASPKVLAHVNLTKPITHKCSLILFLYIIDSNLSLMPMICCQNQPA